MSLQTYRRQGGKNYYIRGSVAGNRIHESTGVSNRAQADAYRIRRESELLERHAYGTNATITFAEAAVTYMQAGGETRFLAPILAHFGEALRLSDINNATLQNAAAAIYANAQPSTINRQLITPVAAIINMAAENGLTEWRKFRRMKGGTTRTRWLTPVEMDRLLENSAPHLAAIIACLVGTGCRVSEALRIHMQDFHPDTGEAWLPDTKNGRPRMIRMPGRARDIILAGVMPASGALFRTPTGQAYATPKRTGSQMKTAFNKARDDAGLGHDVSPHILRHTWATWYYSATRDFGGLMDLGGWQSPSMAERYRKIAPANLGDQLVKHGWDFTRLGQDIPAIPEQKTKLRLVK